MPEPFAADLPASQAVAVTPDDANNLPWTSRAIFVGSAGDLRVDMLGGMTPVTFKGLPAGYICPIRVTRVYATGTTVTDVVAMR